MQEKEKRRKYDISLLVVVFLLVGIGLLILYSTSAYNGEVKFHDSFYYLKKQAFATILGIILMFVMANIDYHIWQHFAVMGYIVALVLSTAVLFIGDEYNGSKRWLSLGPFSFQPSEYAKIALILFISYIVMKNVKTIERIGTLVKIIAAILPIVGLVGSNNLSTAVIILGIAIILIFVSSPKYMQFLTMGGLAAGFLGIFLALESYRLERLEIWRNPEKFEKGYQTLQGLYAIGSGGLFGRGMGESIQKLGFVPEAQNDMIFSIVCEETGILGAFLTLFLFGVLIWRLCILALNCRDLQGTLLCAGIMAHMAIQVVLNVAVVTNTIPNTGITLPFVSYGGTSVVFLLGEMGLALSVSSHRHGRIT